MKLDGSGHELDRESRRSAASGKSAHLFFFGSSMLASFIAWSTSFLKTLALWAASLGLRNFGRFDGRARPAFSRSDWAIVSSTYSRSSSMVFAPTGGEYSLLHCALLVGLV